MSELPLHRNSSLFPSQSTWLEGACTKKIQILENLRSHFKKSIKCLLRSGIQELLNKVLNPKRNKEVAWRATLTTAVLFLLRLPFKRWKKREASRNELKIILYFIDCRKCVFILFKRKIRTKMQIIIDLIGQTFYPLSCMTPIVNKLESMCTLEVTSIR